MVLHLPVAIFPQSGTADSNSWCSSHTALWPGFGSFSYDCTSTSRRKQACAVMGVTGIAGCLHSRVCCCGFLLVISLSWESEDANFIWPTNQSKRPLHNSTARVLRVAFASPVWEAGGSAELG